MTLNARQKRFAEEYAKEPNAGLAAELAGFRQPQSQGPRLLKNVEISNYIQELTKRDKEDRIMSAQEIMERLSTLAREDPDSRVRLDALVALGKRYGLWINRSQVQANIQGQPFDLRQWLTETSKDLPQEEIEEEARFWEKLVGPAYVSR